jgi:hypothetical protein
LLLNIDSVTGEVRLNGSADYEAQPVYHFGVVVHDGELSHDVSQEVEVSVTNVNDNVPVFTSGSTGSVTENADASTVIYQAEGTDADHLVALSYTLSGEDALLLNIDSVTGEVRLNASADYETKPSYSFAVIAHDGDPSHDVSEAVVVSVTNVNDNVPEFSSGSTGSVTENADVSTVIYTANAMDADNLAALTYTLTGEDADKLTIDSATGEVRLNGSADYEAQPVYHFEVVVHDGDPSHDVSKAVVVSVTNVNDNVPEFSLGSSGSVTENADVSTVIYTANATDADNLAALTYTLTGEDADKLTIDSATGEVRLNASADYEAQPVYHFEVVVHDGELSHDVSEAVVVSVQDVNEPPIVSGMLTSIFTEGDLSHDLSLLQGVTDPDSGDVLAVQSVIFRIDGMLTGNGGQNVPEGLSLNGNLLTVDPANAVFDSMGDGVGRMISLDYTISDIHGETVHQTGLITINGVNDAPTSTDDMVSTVYNGEKVFAVTDFGVYQDAEGSALTEVKITTLPEIGTLMHNQDGTTWNPVSKGQSIGIADISAGQLKYMAEVGQTPVTIEFMVSDGTVFSEGSYSLIVDVLQPQYYDVDLTVTWWNDGEGIEEVTALITETSTGVETAASDNGDGKYGYEGLVEGDYTLTATRETADADNDAIDLDDALDALDLVFGDEDESSCQYLAADIDRDGTVGFRDTLGILKMALGRDDAPESKWAIVPADTVNEPRDSSDVNWPEENIAVTLDQDTQIDLVGVLLGDVDGSWGAW